MPQPLAGGARRRDAAATRGARGRRTPAGAAVKIRDKHQGDGRDAAAAGGRRRGATCGSSCSSRPGFRGAPFGPAHHSRSGGALGSRLPLREARARAAPCPSGPPSCARTSADRPAQLTGESIRTLSISASFFSILIGDSFLMWVFFFTHGFNFDFQISLRARGV